MRFTTRQTHAGTADEGFTLVEVVVALALAVGVLLALLSSSVFAIRATLDGRQNQQAGDYLSQAIEAARSLDYGSLSMRSSDLGTDANIVTVSGVKKYNPGTGLEAIDANATGAITPHVVTGSTTNGTYTTKRYVTVPSTATLNAQGMPSVRRLSVEVTWTQHGRTHTRKSSTILTLTRRGLPLPNFTWAYNGPATRVAGVPTWGKNPGNDVDYGFILNNLGARDSWLISSTTTGWSYYVDTDHDGLWSGTASEPALTATDTGLIEPGNGAFYLVAHRTIGSGESGTSTTVFRATSDELSAYSKTVTTSLTVSSGVVVIPSPSPTATASASPTPSPSPTASVACNPGTGTGVVDAGTAPAASTQTQYTLTPLYAYNGSTAGDTTTYAQTSLGTSTSALASAPCNWSTDLQTTQAGRYLDAATNSAASATAKTVEWRFQPGSAAQDEVRGTAVLVLYVQCPSGSPTLTVSFGSLSGATYTARASNVTLAATGCAAGNFKRFDASINMTSNNGFAIATSDKLVVKVQSSAAVRLLFGTTGAASRLVVGLK